MLNEQISEIDGKVSDLGKLEAKVSYQVRGDTELYLRMLFRRVPRNKWNEFVKDLSAYSGVTGEVSDLQVSDPVATHEPFKFTYKISAANYLDWSKKKFDIGLPFSQIQMADADPDDTDPVKVGSPVNYVYKLHIEFPLKYSGTAPLSFSVKRDYGHYEASYRVESNQFTAERTLVTSMNELPSARANDYLAFAARS
jgi:hypothetical protein